MTHTKTKPRIPAVFSLLTAAFLALSIASGFAALSALKQLNDVNYDTSGIAAVQLRLHFNNLLSELRFLELGESEASVEHALLQFDIVYQRLHSLPRRPPYDRILTDGDLAQIQHLTSRFKTAAPVFDAGREQGAEALYGMKERLGHLGEEINRLAGQILQRMQEYRETRRSDIIRSTLFLIFSTLGLVLTGAMFAFLFWRGMARLQHQNSELAAMTEQLSNANQTKTEFLASVSHELRTPLNAIIGFSDIIKNQVFGAIGDRKYTEYAQDINLSGTHLLNLINDILDLSKIEAGEFKVSPRMIGLQSAIAEAVRIVDLSMDHMDSHVDVDIADGLNQIFVDPQSFRQVLINLLSNAYKYSPEGERITITAVPDGDGVCVRVIDRGIGIPAQDLELVLEPFGQSRRDSAQTHEGTGLGLSLCKQLMDLNGGSLRLESELGAGTTVHLWFPGETARESAA